jgi:hypothetical protein
MATNNTLIDYIKKQITIAEQNVHSLYIDLQNASTALDNCDKDSTTTYTSEDSIAEPFPQRAQQTKLKWILNSNNYCVAIVTKKGILQVKSVTDGISDSVVTYTVGGKYPLKKKLFVDEATWRASLPDGGVVLITPYLSNSILKKLSMTPLEGTTDPLKLKELEDRFPNAVFVLSLPNRQIEINSLMVGNVLYICSNTTPYAYCLSYSDFNVDGPFNKYGSTYRPRMMAEWHGLYIDLSHLF